MSDQRVSMERYIDDCTSAVSRRGKYMALVMQELDDRGLDADEILTAAIRRAGKEMATQVGPVGGADEIVRVLCTPMGEDVNRNEIGEVSPERAVLRGYRCPHLATWNAMGLSDSDKIRICGLLENRDVALADELGYRCEFVKRIVEGDSECELVFIRK